MTIVMTDELIDFYAEKYRARIEKGSIPESITFEKFLSIHMNYINWTVFAKGAK